MSGSCCCCIKSSNTPLVLYSSNAQLIIMLKIYFPFSIRRWYFLCYAVPHCVCVYERARALLILFSLLSFFNQFAYKLVITCSLYYLFRLLLLLLSAATAPAATLRYRSPSSSSSSLYCHITSLKHERARACVCVCVLGVCG